MARLRRWLRLILLCGTLVLFYFVVPASPHIPTSAVVARLVMCIVMLVLLALLVVRQLRLQIDEGMDRRIDGLVVSVVAVVITFALGFYILSERETSQVAGLHTRLDSLYFTMTTLTTVGYGDIHATGQTARALVLVQMVFNVVFVAAAATLLSARIREAARERFEARRRSATDTSGGAGPSPRPDPGS